MTAAPGRRPSGNIWLVALWIAVACALAVWCRVDTSGWDTAVYTAAMRSVRAGMDPYRAATDIQIAVHNAGGAATKADPPYSYVYSPLTLPVVRLLTHVPLTLLSGLYWLLYALGAVAQIWVGFRAAKQREGAVVRFLAPVALFFPGLLANGVLLGGNVAYLLYAAVSLAMWRGHRTGRWALFYLAVLLASCVKAPLLCLVLLAPLQARRQWLHAGATAVAGVGLFAMQPLVWPGLFRNYLKAVDLQFQINHDFGCSPAGLFSQWLDSHGIAYTPAGLLFFLAYALPVLLVLLYLSRRYLQGAFDWQDWFPVLLTGVVLVNPRLIEYDVAPLALPLALIAWRSLREWCGSARAAGVVAAGLFLLLNVGAVMSWNLRKWLDGALLMALFAAGAIRLGCVAAQRSALLEGTRLRVS